MKYYPVALNVKGKNCLVAGGGSVAYRKIMQLIKSGAHVKVVAADVIKGIERLEAKGRIKLIKRKYRRADINNMFLVFAAAGDSSVNKKIFDHTRSKNILLNATDSPDRCDFIMPAVLTKGRITIAVSTGGSAPYASVLVKKRIDKLMDTEYVKLIDAVINIRSRLWTIKKQGGKINIEYMLNKLSLAQLSKCVKDNNKEVVKRYIDRFLSLNLTDKKSVNLLGKQFQRSAVKSKGG